MSQCPFCGAEEYQIRSGVIAGKRRYKCRYCVRYYTEGVEPRAKPPEKPPVLHKCLNCGRESPNPKFCSKECHLAYGTFKPKNPKKRRPRFCKYCGVPVNNKGRVCKDCNPNNVDWSKRTLGELQNSAKYQVNAALRNSARRIYRQSGRPQQCQNCGYSIHIEICHIHAINSFSEDTPISVINDPDNLVALCPNCHWEFDHNELSIEAIERKMGVTR